MRRAPLFALAVLLSLATWVWAAEPAAETEPEPANFWMKHKLENSHKIFDALAMGDFDAIAAGASSMRKISKIEAFARRKDAESYRVQLRVFDFANAELVRLANERNLDGAATAFNQLTLSCLNCHKLLRDQE